VVPSLRSPTRGHAASSCERPIHRAIAGLQQGFTYQQDNRGGKLRQALRAHTGSNTFPQIFIAGEFVGGCSELFDACKDGQLAERLQAHGIPYDKTVSDDPYSFLPGWLHPR
jgi:cysteine synthase A